MIERECCLRGSEPGDDFTLTVKSAELSVWCFQLAAVQDNDGGFLRQGPHDPSLTA